MTISRRNVIRNIVGAGIGIASFPVASASGMLKVNNDDPTKCDYAPPGEYIKDHTFVFHDGWWHLFSISGTRGYYHGYTGNEETISWSISQNLIDWEFRGHVLHASLRKGDFDQHEVWAPFCLKANNKFYMYYTGIINPYRPMEYRRLGHGHRYKGGFHKETQGLAVSDDLTEWTKVCDQEKGLGVQGRDSNITWDDQKKRWLLYSTGGVVNIDGKVFGEILVSQSQNLIDWEFIGTCALFSKSNESIVTMKNPTSGKWILMGNWEFVVSDDPVNFLNSKVRAYDNSLNGETVDLGFACEILQYNNKWYRSGVFGEWDYWRLGFTEIEWDKNGAFKVVRPSVTTNK